MAKSAQSGPAQADHYRKVKAVFSPAAIGQLDFATIL
jgi:hypothetical protein